MVPKLEIGQEPLAEASPVFDVPSVMDCMPMTGSFPAKVLIPVSTSYPGTIVPVYGWYAAGPP